MCASVAAGLHGALFGALGSACTSHRPPQELAGFQFLAELPSGSMRLEKPCQAVIHNDSERMGSKLRISQDPSV